MRHSEALSKRDFFLYSALLFLHPFYSIIHYAYVDTYRELGRIGKLLGFDFFLHLLFIYFLYQRKDQFYSIIKYEFIFVVSYSLLIEAMRGEYVFLFFEIIILLAIILFHHYRKYFAYVAVLPILFFCYQSILIGYRVNFPDLGYRAFHTDEKKVKRVKAAYPSLADFSLLGRKGKAENYHYDFLIADEGIYFRQSNNKGYAALNPYLLLYHNEWPSSPGYQKIASFNYKLDKDILKHHEYFRLEARQKYRSFWKGKWCVPASKGAEGLELSCLRSCGDTQLRIIEQLLTEFGC